jgi:hypothetical protein
VGAVAAVVAMVVGVAVVAEAVVVVAGAAVAAAVVPAPAGAARAMGRRWLSAAGVPVPVAPAAGVLVADRQAAGTWAGAGRLRAAGRCPRVRQCAPKAQLSSQAS